MNDETEAPMHDSWDDLAEWWRAEITGDVVYEADVFPMYRSLTEGVEGIVLDLGCGDGQAMPFTGSRTIGVDASMDLLRHAATRGPVLRAQLPDLSMIRSASIDHAGSIYLVDLIENDLAFFESVARVVKRDGTLVVVINHPVYTAPGSAPIADVDGEVLWRWGDYTTVGFTDEPAGERTVRFYHRPLGTLVEHAASAGWDLERLEERPLSSSVIAALPGYAGQDTIPRLLGIRWRRR